MTDVRHFDATDSADPLHLLPWLQRIGHSISIPNNKIATRFYAPYAKKAKFHVDDKVLGSKQFLELVDEERAARGLEPIVRRK